MVLSGTTFFLPSGPASRRRSITLTLILAKAWARPQKSIYGPTLGTVILLLMIQVWRLWWLKVLILTCGCRTFLLRGFGKFLQTGLFGSCVWQTIWLPLLIPITLGWKHNVRGHLELKDAYNFIVKPAIDFPYSKAILYNCIPSSRSIMVWRMLQIPTDDFIMDKGILLASWCPVISC